jgi:hypothetical protein
MSTTAPEETRDPEKPSPSPVGPFTAFHQMVIAWKDAMKFANRARCLADSAYAEFILESNKKVELKNSESRTAYADQMTADLFCKAADAEADARALGALVEYFTTRRSQ